MPSSDRPQPDRRQPDRSRPEGPEQEARLRRLLADARHSDPIPTDVAARLDRVLEGLAGEERDDDAPPVATLAARRRRRTTQILVAAVAVVAVGFGYNAIAGPDGGSEDSAGSAADSTSDSAAAPRSADASAESQAGAGSQESRGSADTQDSAPAPPVLTQAPAQARGRSAFLVREDRFVRDVRRLRGVSGTQVTDPAQVVADDGLGGGPGFVCDDASYGTGTLLPVRYEGNAAVLAYREPTGDTQAVDLLQCGSAQLLRSTTVPLRR